MRKFWVIGLITLGKIGAGAPYPEPSTYDLVVAGMKCTQSEPAYQKTPQSECHFNVGSGLEFYVVGIGQEDVTFTVYRSSFEGDYYISVPAGTVHRCAIVKPGRATQSKAKALADATDYAFVSPQTGRVYRTWQQCAAG